MPRIGRRKPQGHTRKRSAHRQCRRAVSDSDQWRRSRIFSNNLVSGTSRRLSELIRSTRSTLTANVPVSVLAIQPFAFRYPRDEISRCSRWDPTRRSSSSSPMPRTFVSNLDRGAVATFSASKVTAAMMRASQAIVSAIKIFAGRLAAPGPNPPPAPSQDPERDSARPTG